MILFDTSVWIDHLRGHSTRAASQADALIDSRPEELAITEPVAMELLAGAKPLDLSSVHTLVSSLPMLSVRPSTDFIDAATVFRATRANGRGARNIVDCLIAVVAMHHDAELWHKDTDFEAIAAVTKLRTLDLR